MTEKNVEGLSQPLGGRKLIPLIIQVIQVEISICAASVISIVLLILPKTHLFELSAIKLITGRGIYGYLFYKRSYISYSR